ncbi:hypothetical protein [Pseudoalteromonas sp. APC 3907]|uniref:hypothetical protein n=1 Tax=Pseudoalteromonas sp. APC 3907 TaxID=3035186 RepID=UPI0025B3E8F6|nr:hypothetical protein [Pseudoalteromonas sp. APC 3907]MDN3431423.1 hypothetical protein [Pseudoalteromonas sp. APC 3907]
MNELTINIKNPLTEPLNKIKREMVEREFFADTEAFTDYPLSLYKYLSLRPEKFYCKRTLSAQLKFLDSGSNTSSIIEIINENVTHLEQSLKLLDDINKKPWHDLNLSSDEHDLFRHCDNNVNPSYLNLIEGVFGNLIYINAIASRHNRDKSPDGLDIFNRFEEIKRTSLGFLADEYCNTTRNSIAHGSVKYLHHDIEFRDKKKTITNTHSEYLKRFDSVLDICNGLALAYKIFFFKNITNVRIPKQVLLEELYAQTEAPWWQIEGCLESEVGKSDSQLVIFIKPETRDYGKVRLSAISTAVLAERYAPGYKRYFLSMRSPVALPGFAAFDGELLKDKREKKVSKWEEYSGIIEGDLIFWVPFITPPKLINKISTYSLSIKLFLATQRLLKTINSGVELHSRNAKIHRNGWRVVLNADVVIESSYIVSTSDIKNIGKKLIKIALKAARKQLPLYSFLRYLPIGYARVSLFNNDYRCSHLHGFGLRKELIGTVKLQKIKKIKTPDLFGSSIENDGRLTYAWNKSWLEQ